jgi:flavin-binding protein dodecin
MESTYKIVELVGSSPESWEKAAEVALKEARKSLRDLRIAEVDALDIHIDEDGKIVAYRTKLKVSFKYQTG